MLSLFMRQFTRKRQSKEDNFYLLLIPIALCRGLKWNIAAICNKINMDWELEIILKSGNL